MWHFALRRGTVLLLTLLVVSMIAFLIPYIGEGDPALLVLRARIADPNVDHVTLEAMRRQLGLDRPLAVQYLAWLSDAVRGDFGLSFTSRAPVTDMLGGALIVSITLALSALLIALLVSAPLGTAAAMRPGGGADTAATLLTQTLIAIPAYWMAPMSILVFALWLGWLPSAGWNGPASLVLPALVLALRPLAYFTRIIRASMIDVLDAPFITAARSRGLSLTQTVMRHGLRNGAMPVITMFALWLAGLLGGSVIVEVIFAIPGMGRLIYEAVINKDIPVLQGGFVAIVTFAVLVNTLVDLAYLAINPALRHSHGA
ncbi:ABC transporter permease [Bosea sp. PAMC 26642]|uniref:ABC transporter permease n=1 Tax=Bosea sp. (strain PAMC 26642) TaxID=1792307 RepID=UPI00077035F1|nr:ABC transporter permease [Bosea sp. PAMC 26642]AMJ61711.1 ABC transporter permease [Bosea sp. PAMC 26642]